MPTIGLLDIPATIVRVTTTSYTLQASDNNKTIVLTSTTAMSLNLPNNLPVGFTCRVIQGGTGQVSLVAAGGTSLNHRLSHNRLAGQYARAELLVVSNATGAAAVYNLSGDTAGTTTTSPAGPTLYVSTTGNDANSGTQSSPVRTLARASALAQPGHTVILRGGTYVGPHSFDASGTSASPITIQPADGETVIFEGSGMAANTNLISIGGDYVVFQGFDVRNATRSGIVLWETQGCKVQNNKVHGCFVSGIWIGGGTAGASANNLVAGNEVYDNVRENVGQAMGSGGWAVACALANSDGSIIQSNYVHHNYGEGIGILSCIGAKLLNNTVHDCFSINLYLDNAQNATVQGNTSYHSGDTNFYRNNQPAHGCIIANENTSRMLPSSGITVTNNTFAGSPTTVHYGTYGANTGLSASTITPNTYYSTIQEYWAAQ